MDRRIDYDKKTCLNAAEKFLCGDMGYAAADITTAQTGDTRGLDYWIDRYFEETPPLENVCLKCESYKSDGNHCAATKTRPIEKPHINCNDFWPKSN